MFLLQHDRCTLFLNHLSAEKQNELSEGQPIYVFELPSKHKSWADNHNIHPLSNHALDLPRPIRLTSCCISLFCSTFFQNVRDNFYITADLQTESHSLAI